MGLIFEVIDNPILNEYFTNLFRPGYVRVKGTTLPKRFLDFHDSIENFTVYDDDLWICSFPKSGTTWTQEMVWMILNNLDFENGKKCLGERFPFLDYEFLFDYRNVHKKIRNFNPPVHFEKSIDFVKNLQRPRLIKTHLPWDLLPKQIQNGEKHPKMIYVARNPQDVCLSYYHHCRLIEGYASDFSNFADLFLSGNLSYAPYWTNVLQYWKKRSEPNVLFLKFEDLKKDLASVIREVAEFVCKDVTDEEMGKLLDHLSFESMKSNQAVSYNSVVSLHKNHNFTDYEGAFIRSGTVASYKSEYTEELKKLFDEWTQNESTGCVL